MTARKSCKSFSFEAFASSTLMEYICMNNKGRPTVNVTIQPYRYRMNKNNLNTIQQYYLDLQHYVCELSNTEYLYGLKSFKIFPNLVLKHVRLVYEYGFTRYRVNCVSSCYALFAAF